jgi:hypothetical protein
MALRQFFNRYAELSQKSDPVKLADMYAPSFIAAGPKGSSAFANDPKFLEWLAQTYAFNQKHGMQSLAVVAIHEATLSPSHALATVTWGARFEKTGDRIIEFDISYLVEKAGKSWKILAYVSRADQEDEMKKLGLL